MADYSGRKATFWKQTHALLMKEIAYRKRNVMSTCKFLLLPVLLISILYIFQEKIGDGNEPPTLENPPKLVPLLQVPPPEERAESPDAPCIANRNCAVLILHTAKNRAFSESLAPNIIPASPYSRSHNKWETIAHYVLGTDELPADELAKERLGTLYQIQHECTFNSSYVVSDLLQQDVVCIQGRYVWQSNSSEIDKVILNTSRSKSNVIMAAFDFRNSDSSNLNATIWFDSSHKDEAFGDVVPQLRVSRSINLVARAYLQTVDGPNTMSNFEYVKEMPKHEQRKAKDTSLDYGVVIFMGIIMLPFPEILKSLVYEKQEKLKIMMAMHGLSRGPHVTISYSYHAIVSFLYALFFLGSGRILGFNFFTKNDFKLQMAFLLIYGNLQTGWAFLASSCFSDVKTAKVTARILIFATTIISIYIESILSDPYSSRVWIIVAELFPGFSLLKGLYEFSRYAEVTLEVTQRRMNVDEMIINIDGIKEVLTVIGLQFVAIIVLICNLGKIESAVSAVWRTSYTFFCKGSQNLSSIQNHHSRRLSEARTPFDQFGVCEERMTVKQLVRVPISIDIVCDDLVKKYYGNGNHNVHAVKGLSFCVSRGQCFGILGASGSGKTSLINMMIGLSKPSSGTAHVMGQNIMHSMRHVYASMGSCPQESLLWGCLSARDHLVFYGRLRNLRGAALKEEVQRCLEKVNLCFGGAPDDLVKRFSRGMRRRLSVAIALIGQAKVVYLDQPTTGLDPATRRHLWGVLKDEKKTRAIILSTNSPEEASFLCDRVGILVEGQMQCIGTPEQLTAIYGEYYHLTVKTNPEHEKDVSEVVKGEMVYNFNGYKKYRIEKSHASMFQIFNTVHNLNSIFPVQMIDVNQTTLEEVFDYVNENSLLAV